MLSKQRILAVALHLCVATQSDAFSLRPASGAAFAAVAPRGGRLVVVAPTHRTAPALRADRRPARRTGPLFAGGSALIPSYEEIMERLPSKKVLEEVERKRGAPIVASGERARRGGARASFRALAFRRTVPLKGTMEGEGAVAPTS